MACPDCGSPSGELRFATSIETHGLDCGPFERFDEEFIVCRRCGGRFDPRDWEETATVPPSMPECVDVLEEGDNVSGRGAPFPSSSAPPPPPYDRGRSFDVETCSKDPL